MTTTVIPERSEESHVGKGGAPALEELSCITLPRTPGTSASKLDHAVTAAAHQDTTKFSPPARPVILRMHLQIAPILRAHQTAAPGSIVRPSTAPSFAPRFHTSGARK